MGSSGKMEFAYEIISSLTPSIEKQYCGDVAAIRGRIV
jgi:hypothetical protein